MNKITPQEETTPSAQENQQTIAKTVYFTVEAAKQLDLHRTQTGTPFSVLIKMLLKKEGVLD